VALEDLLSKKQKFFAWLLLQDHLNTRDLLLRRIFFLDNYSWIMCNDQNLETRDRMYLLEIHLSWLECTPVYYSFAVYL
jgi:hypothetical protein